MIKILIGEDHTLFSEGLARMLEESRLFKVTNIINNCTELKEILKSTKAEILLLDIKFSDGNGFDILQYIIDNQIVIKTAIISMFNDNIYIKNAKKLNAKGYFPKDIDFESLLISLQKINEGYEVFYQDERTRFRDLNDYNQVLSLREIEIINLLSEGLNNEDISKKLILSIETVKTHRKNAMQKLKAKSLQELLINFRKLDSI